MHDHVLKLRNAIPIGNNEEGDGECKTEGERLFLIESSAKAEKVELEKRLKKLNEAPADIGLWNREHRQYF